MHATILACYHFVEVITALELLHYFAYLKQTQPSEAVSVAWFVAGLAAFYALTAATALSFLLTARRRDSRKLPRRLVMFRQLIFALVIAGIVCHLYAFFIEPNWIEIKHVRLTTSKFDAGSVGMRLLQISDLHCDVLPGLEERLPDIIAREHPDVIVFTGDSINAVEGLPRFKKCMSRLSRVAPVLAVTGNHDAFEWTGTDLLAGTGCRWLDRESVPVKVGVNTIWIAGVAADRQAPEIALHSIPPEGFSVLLNHYSAAIYRAANCHADLYLAGHTHGGQIALPFYGALATFSEFGKRFESGLYKVDGTWLYVNRGIGMDGGAFPRARFCARPEVTVFDISPEQ